MKAVTGTAGKIRASSQIGADAGHATAANFKYGSEIVADQTEAGTTLAGGLELHEAANNFFNSLRARACSRVAIDTSTNSCPPRRRYEGAAQTAGPHRHRACGTKAATQTATRAERLDQDRLQHQ